MAVTREQVLAAYAANPRAETLPSEESIKYWQKEGLDSFYQAVDAVRAQNPEFAGQIDALQAASPKTAEFKQEQTNNLANQILATTDTSKWTGEGFGSAQKNAADMARVLSNAGITDISQLGTRQISTPTNQGVNEFGGALDFPDVVSTQYYNKATGQPVVAGYDRAGGNIFSGTFAGEGSTKYGVQFDPQNNPRFYTQYGGSSNSLAQLLEDPVFGTLANIGASVFGGPLGSAALQLAQGKSFEDAAKAGLMTYAGQELMAPGTVTTDASFLAADAAQLAQQGLSEAAIAQNLGAYGSQAAANLAASMAVNGLDTATMTQQLNNLGTNTGLMSQTGSAADFAAADALQLQGQVGNNFAAIEQNLIASGVDPLIAADISNQIAMNPGLTQAQLATNISNNFGSNIYDVNAAQTYPTSILPGQGGLLSDAAAMGNTAAYTAPAAATGATAGAGAGTTAAAADTAAAGTGLSSSQIANLIKAGVSLAGIGGAAGALGGGSQGGAGTFVAPTQQQAAYTPEYYNQLQQYYNAYMPQTPRDVVTPLQQWYNSPKVA